ncbi:MAG TPA: diaminopimelate decarboxylase, partial [Gemmatimonadales bacterium]|nr:diaminopimelate decarboxylase [Gemmatimonadales bacterium]
MGEGVLTAAADPSALLADAGLVRREGELALGGVPLRAIAEAHGTPTYAYNAEVVRGQFGRLDRALAPVPHRICFAVKANGNLGVLRVLRDLGAGADIVSVGEMHRALAAGFAPAHIVFSGVGKRADELRAAVRAGVGHVNVESLDELALLGEVAREEDRRVAVGIRVNPDVTAETHPYISTGRSGIKFGVPIDQALPAAASLRGHPHLELVALAMHIGSQLTDVAPYVQGARRMAELVEAVRARGVDTLRAIDLGGGLGIRYLDETPIDPADYAAAVLPIVAPLGLELYVEPGRFLVGSAGVLVTRVLYRKHSGGKEFVIVDAGMN